MNKHHAEPPGRTPERKGIEMKRMIEQEVKVEMRTPIENEDEAS